MLSSFHAKYKVTCALLLMSSLQVACAVPLLLQAFQQTFHLHDGSVVSSERTAAVQWVVDIMQRQGIPHGITALRALSDSDLLSIAMRAAIAGISPW